MESDGTKEYYSKGKLSVTFDSRMGGYWLGVGASKYFLDDELYHEIQFTEGSFGKLNKFEAYDKVIFEDFKRNGIMPSQLEEMFSEVGKMESRELREANNL